MRLDGNKVVMDRTTLRLNSNGSTTKASTLVDANANMKPTNGKDRFPQETWSEQKQRMDDMLEVLRSEFKQVQTIDKDLTRQFIILGGKINKLKVNQNQLLLRLEEEMAEDIFEDGETSTKETLSLDTKL